jgi:thiamine-phosphate pyrophosphorylase
MAPNVAAIIRLMLVTDDRLVDGRELIQLCRAAVAGGVTAVELRLKQASAIQLVQAARSLIAALDVPVLINDRMDVAIAAGGAGVHLGSDDLPVPLARRLAPEGFLIGASVGLAEEVENGLGADYWGVGPWRETSTKHDAGIALGPDGFRKIARMSEGKPCVAIGGVRPVDVASIFEAGGAGVAVVTGILGAPDVTAAARDYASRIPGLTPH